MQKKKGIGQKCIDYLGPTYFNCSINNNFKKHIRLYNKINLRIPKYKSRV